ncbi:hypothetical protein TIFTF001_013490 [Ficus carica]|uniref:Uncharacterized protein n=1 Tax=Ficus carica TaxID=3494 RepID=A0AA87ZXU6_FICCA|nr:hypothetical protein TIFTF001_013490 [Ficus carica]
MSEDRIRIQPASAGPSRQNNRNPRPATPSDVIPRECTALFTLSERHAMSVLLDNQSHGLQFLLVEVYAAIRGDPPEVHFVRPAIHSPNISREIRQYDAPDT